MVASATNAASASASSRSVSTSPACVPSSRTTRSNASPCRDLVATIAEMSVPARNGVPLRHGRSNGGRRRCRATSSQTSTLATARGNALNAGVGTLDHVTDDTSAGLLDEIEVIEEQPLERRAEAFAALHDRLEAALAGS